MRVISQDGRLDFPYENSVVFIPPREETIVRAQMTGDDESARMAQYSTKEKAKKAMEMLRDAYENNVFYHCTAGSKRFEEVQSILSEEQFQKFTSEYFQFPAEEELE